MNIKTLYLLALVCALACSGTVFAQANPSISVGQDAGVPGAAVSVPLNWDQGGSTYNGVEFKVGFNTSLLAFDSCTLNAPYNTYALKICQVNGSDVEIGLISDLISPQPVPSGELGTVTFIIDAAALPATTPLTVNGVVLPGDPSVDLTNGQIEILGPAYTSSPTAPGPIDLGSVQTGGTNPSQLLTITNTGGAGTTLDVTCVESPDTTAFIVNNGSFTGLVQNASHDVEVACNAALAPNTYNGTLSCTHNGTNVSSPVEYNLSCTVTPGPEPAYGSSPAPGATISMNATNVGDPIASQMVSISNIGDSGTTLSGTCGLSGDSEISATGDGAYSVLQGAPAHVVTLSCDSSAQGSYSATLSCSHNGTNISSPATYTVNCDVGPLRPAQFASDPASGTPVNLTPDAVPVGATAPTAPLSLQNTATAPAQDLPILCTMGGTDPTVITASPAVDTTIAPESSLGVTFSCDTSTIGTYSAQYSCAYREDSEGSQQNATWDLSCEVREAKSVVEPQTPSGTTVTQSVTQGGSAQYDFAFDETADEGVNGSVDCSLDDGTNFSILTSLPADVPAGGTLTVSVEGTDPDNGSDSVSDALLCTYRDTDHPETGVQVRYPLVLEIGGRIASFRVTKAYSDGNTDEVEVTLTCNTGLPLQQSAMISEGHSVNFVVQDFTEGEMDCTVTETGTADGYTPTYYNGTAYSDTDCSYVDVVADQYVCEITNAADAATYTVTKEWIVDGAAADAIDKTADVHITCDSAIMNVAGGKPLPALVIISQDVWVTLEGESDSATVTVDTTNGTAHCSAVEDITQSGVETESDAGCTNATLVAGGSATCTITNTVFFEGIPTLSQWGLAILVVLTLGIGLVGFRRFV